LDEEVGGRHGDVLEKRRQNIEQSPAYQSDCNVLRSLQVVNAFDFLVCPERRTSSLGKEFTQEQPLSDSISLLREDWPKS